MNWIVTGILSHLSWGTSNIIDKYIISNRVKNIRVFLVWMSWLGALTIFALPWIDFSYPGHTVLLWLALCGFMYTIGFLWYLKAVEISEISRINIWWNLIPVFSLLFGWIFLKELPNQGQFMAMTVLFIASIIGSINFTRDQKFFSPGLWWIIAFCIEFSLYSIIIRMVGQNVSIPFVFIYINFIRGVSVLFFFASKKFRTEFVTETKRITPGIGFWLLATISIDYLGTALGQWALKDGQVALVLSLEGVQALYVFFISLCIAKLWPRALQESTEQKNIVVKVLALILALVGIILFSYFSF